jgi:hypothetical protein
MGILNTLSIHLPDKEIVVSNIVSFPPLNYPPSVLAVFLVVALVVVLLSCCCHCLCLLFCRVANTAAVATVGMPPPPQLPSVSKEDDACYTNANSTLPRRRMLSAGRWNPARCWTGPSRPVARAAKAVMMMAAPAVVAKVGLRTGLVWSFPPPLEAAQQQQGWQASEGRGNKEGNCNGDKGGKR